ncbi:MAG: hypothetical protein AB7K71_41120, partial [Polyangiaceae bacterium]
VALDQLPEWARRAVGPLDEETGKRYGWYEHPGLRGPSCPLHQAPPLWAGLVGTIITAGICGLLYLTRRRAEQLGPWARHPPLRSARWEQGLRRG